MVQNLPSNALNMGSFPGRGTKILHAAGQLSLSDRIEDPEQPTK